jgi:hypothetical protein
MGPSKTGPSASDGWQGCILVFDTFISLKTSLIFFLFEKKNGKLH